VSVVGIELITIDARIVVAGTYLKRPSRPSGFAVATAP